MLRTRESRSAGSPREGVLGLLQVGDEAVDRDDGPRAGEGGRPRRRRRDHRPAAVWRRLRPAAAWSRPTGPPPGEAVRSAWTWWMAGNRVRMAGTWIGTGAGAASAGGPLGVTRRSGDGATGRSASASSAAAPSQFSGSGSHRSGRRTRLGQACRSTLNQAIPSSAKLLRNRDESSRPGGGRWPSGSARGGWRAGACAAPTTRGSRPSSPTGAAAARPPCR